MKLSKQIIIFIIFISIFYVEYLIWCNYISEGFYNKTKGITFIDQKVVKKLEKAEELNPLESRYPFEIAEIYLKEGNYQLAKAKYMEAISLEPTKALFHVELAQTYYQLVSEDKDYRGEAIDEFKKAVLLNPTDSHLRLVAGKGYFYLGLDKKVILDEFKECLVPSCGISITLSHWFIACWETPFTSLPNALATAGENFVHSAVE